MHRAKQSWRGNNPSTDEGVWCFDVAAGEGVQTPEVAWMYIGSFWDQPLHFDENRKLFETKRNDFICADIQSLPHTAIVRKVNELIKRVRLAKVHAFILYQLCSEMPSCFGKQLKKAELIANLA